jgi:hypothetical protein
MSATILQLPASKRITPPLKPSEDPEAKEKAARRSYRENLLHEAKARATASDDPIFGAIVSHLDAVVAKYTHSDDASEMSFEEEQADEPYSNELDERCGDTLKVVLSTAPTTMAGVVALLEHVALHEFLYPVRLPAMKRFSRATMSTAASGKGSARTFHFAWPRRSEA